MLPCYFGKNGWLLLLVVIEVVVVYNAMTVSAQQQQQANTSATAPGRSNTTIQDNDDSNNFQDDVAADVGATNTNNKRTIHILTFDNPGTDYINMKKSAQSYYEKTGIQVLYDAIPDFLGLYDEIRSQAELKLPLYDGYICGPGVIGTAVQLDGWLDLTDIVRDRRDLQWLDVLRGFRENIAVYDKRVWMFPLDGDAHFLFYRQDVLEHFGLPVPRTWEEYWQVAQAVHGQVYKNQTMVGSCVGRRLGAQSSYWASLVLSSYTQTKGRTEGFMLDSEDLEPLMGEAMAETLKMLELQATYGHPQEFEMGGGGDGDSINIDAMNDGYCALTYNWGDSYKMSHTSDPQSQVAGLLLASRTPGTTKVYNRKTKKLEPCTEETCGGSGGTYYEDIGWVNRAAYLAFGGVSAAVNSNIAPEQQQLVTDYFAYMCSPEISLDAAVPNATTPRSAGNGVDPFRASHMDLDVWVQQGYERTSAESYLQAVLGTLYNPNAATDMRFAGADLIYSVLEEEIYYYLEKAVVMKTLPDDEEQRHQVRLELADTLAEKFREIVLTENAKPETRMPLLEQFQRDLGIYKPSINHRVIDSIRPAGYTLASIIIASSIGFAAWVLVNRTSPVVKGSQPLFLLFICVGTFTMGTAIIPLGMDDSFFDKVGDDCPGCDTACMAWPWLFFIGFTIVFAAIFSKLWRIDQVIDRAKRFQKIRVENKDVLLPFACLFLLNVIFLTLWTTLDPLTWQRIREDDMNTYGTCKPEDGVPAKVLGSLLAVVNVGALLMAEVQAYKARNISDHLSESNYIGIATVGMFQVFIIGVPVIFLVTGEPEAQYFVYSGIIFVICMAMLLLIFIPKCIYNRQPDKPRSYMREGSFEGSVRSSSLRVLMSEYSNMQLGHLSADGQNNGYLDKHNDDDNENVVQKLRRDLEECQSTLASYRAKYNTLEKRLKQDGLTNVDQLLSIIGTIEDDDTPPKKSVQFDRTNSERDSKQEKDDEDEETKKE